MKTHKLAKRLMKELPLTQLDVTRLLLEASDYIGDLTQGQNRYEMLALLRRLIREGAECLHAKEQSVTLREAVTASVFARRHLRPTTRRDLRFFARRLIDVEMYADIPLNRMSTALCRRLLETAFGDGGSMYIKGRAILHSVFTYGAQREWCSENPVKPIVAPKHQENPITPLTLAEVKRLKEAARRPDFRAMRLSLVLLLYCGIRPTEIARLSANDICWKEKLVIIRPRTSKTGGGRMVPIRFAIEKFKADERVIPNDWERRWRALRRAAGFRSWRADRCRHTFASYHAAYFRNLSALQMEMGHRDSTLLRTRYVTPAKYDIAAKFWKEAEL